MAVRGDHRARALWRGHGLQRVSRARAKGERKPVLLRDQARRLGRDRFRRDVAGDAVQLSTAKEPPHRLHAPASLHARSVCSVRIQQHERRASLAQVADRKSTRLNSNLFPYRTLFRSLLTSRCIVSPLLLLCTLGLFAVFGFSSTNGAHRWIKLPGVSMQPSEISKLALIIFLAYFLEKRAGEEGDFWRTFVPCGIVTGWLAALVVIEPDFGTALMLTLIFTVVIYTAGARVLHLAMAAAPALIVAAAIA